MPPREELNARSTAVTTTTLDTHGILNRKATNNPSFQIGIVADKGHRRAMEDSHSFVFDFASIRGQGFFAVFDGHAGKHAAEWCGQHFHEELLQTITEHPDLPIPDALNQTFANVDIKLSEIANASGGKMHSGCTAVATLLRIEDETGGQAFLTDSPTTDSPTTDSPPSSQTLVDKPDSTSDSPTRKSYGSNKIKQALKSSLSSVIPSSSSSSIPPPASPSSSSVDGTATPVITPPENVRRVLYCANAGDARGVLCRAGVALRLTYDHKGSDKQEAKRITDAGGFVMSGRVNGVLAVTRSLGDSSMKEFVVGAPYTTETELCPDDQFLILACDGLWDITSDQRAVDHVRHIMDPQEQAAALVKLALDEHSQDNVTITVIRFKHPLTYSPE